MNKSKLKAKIKKYVSESNSVSFKTVELSEQEIINASILLGETLKSGNKIMICGNGGSASDSSHLAAEFTNQFSDNISRHGLAAISLSSDSTFITAHSNDFSFETVFSRQIESLGKENDVLLGITTSGKSKNILKALEQANSMNIKTILLTGNNTILNKLASITINIQSENTQYIQESMLQIEHLLISFVEEIICKS